MINPAIGALQVSKALLPRLDRPLTILAHTVSIAFIPPLVILYLALTAAVTVGQELAGFWPLWFVAGNGLVPALVTVGLWKSGQITDLDISRREQRAIPVLAGLGAALLTAVVAQAAGADQPFGTMSLASLVLFAALGVATIRLKVSVHAATMFSWVACCLVLGAAIAPWVALAAVVTGWSRVWLGRHQKREVVLGGLAGLMIPALVLAVALG